MIVGRCSYAFAPAVALALGACNMDSSPALQDPTTGMADTGTELVPVQQAVQRPELAGTDLGTMNGAEVRKVVPPGPHCSFSYVRDGRPVFIAVPGDGTSHGFAKLHGQLVRLPAVEVTDLASGGLFAADGMAIAVEPIDGARATTEQVEADLVFQLEQGLRVGYGGFYRCAETGLPRAE